MKFLIGLLTIVTAYNTVVAQTDNTPCVGARNFNVCEALGRGERICAANWVPLGTKLAVPGYGECVVRDRMPAKYGKRVDIAMLANEVDRAKKWGNQNLNVKIIKL